MSTKEAKKAPSKKKAVAVKPKSDVGRKTLLTPEIEEEIMKQIGAGIAVRHALKAQGIPERSFYNWTKRGAEEQERLDRNPDAKPDPDEFVFWQFWQSLERAKSTAVNAHVATIASAAKRGDWRASAWWLERTHPEEYGKNQTTTVIGTQNNNTQINIAVTMAEIQKSIEEVMLMRELNDRKTD